MTKQPQYKVCRRLGARVFSKCENPKLSLTSSKSRPTQKKRRFRPMSEFGTQLLEKQKVRYIYGLRERQFSNYVKAASRKKGVNPAEELYRTLESRLDNVVFRLGIAPTRSGARQLVGHKHITVNGKLVNVPSYSVKEGDEVGIREKSKSLEAITASLAANPMSFDWLEWNDSQMSGRFINSPERTQIPENIKEQLIVELYSK